VCTGAYAGLVRAWRDGEAERARSLGYRLGGLSAAPFAGPNPTVIRAVLHAQGRIPSPAARLPLAEATQEAAAAAADRVRELADAPAGV
jgi:4-hydroxy-tetrahydrodipicolinate synthase